MQSKTTVRRGVTALEVVVSMTIVGLLMTILLPALHRVRESARKAQCAGNLKEIGLAMAGFESVQGHLPGIATEVVSRSALDPRIGFDHQCAWISVHAQLLPYLDHANLAAKIDFSEQRPNSYLPPSSSVNAAALQIHVPVFNCPSDGLIQGGCSYRVSVANVSYPRAIRGDLDSVFFWTDGYGSSSEGRLWEGTKIEQILDGLSHTVFASERVVGDGYSGAYNSYRDIAILDQVPQIPDDAVHAACQFSRSAVIADESAVGTTWLYAGFAHTQYNHVLPPNSRLPDCASSGGRGQFVQGGAVAARSLHFSGVNVLFGDGAVRFTSENIDTSVWREAATVASGNLHQGNF